MGQGEGGENFVLNDNARCVCVSRTKVTYLCSTEKKISPKDNTHSNVAATLPLRGTFLHECRG